MHVMKRAVAFGVAVTLGVVLSAGLTSVSAQEGEARGGTWKLNLEKSKYNPGPPPKSLMMKVEASKEGEKVATEGVNATGTATKTEYTAQFDGKDYPLTGSQNADKVALKKIDARTTERLYKKGDTLMLTFVQVISPDGKTMTTTTKGKNAQGQDVDNVQVWEKQ